MKKITLLWAIMCMSAMVFAQTKNLKSADRSLKNGKLDKAVESIKLAMAEPENQAEPNAWFSQAKIYTAVTATDKPEYKDLEKNSANLAMESFQKAFELDPSGKIKILGSLEVGKLVNATYDLGATLYAEQKFLDAATAFKLTVAANTLIDVIDTNAIFNTALCADAGQDKKTAKEYYTKLVELKANQPNAYISLAGMVRDEGDKAEAQRLADMAVEMFPGNYNVAINASGIHLTTENSARAQQILNHLTETQDTNQLVFFALGVAYDQMKNPVEAEKAYLRAIELKPDYFDAIFNLGAFYVNQGIEIKKEADGLPLSETAKYEAMVAQSNEMFKKAIPMLEKALNDKPNDIPVMSTLKDLYVHLQMMDKAKEISDQIEELGTN
ncbi:MAG: tetratricopeptide repeat protein [Bacteroidales bacterium]|jgi:tetratricopeptide (TPR) repeat protein|nr:tetratricopeptide repeat protein [Bacteroidales bacterium]